MNNGRFHTVNDSPNIIANNSANFHLVNCLLWFISPEALDKSKTENELIEIHRDKSDGVESLLKGMV